ncbi:UEV domain-containing protein [Hyaloraphidium curvatum]|nr:UEV domain-containing protein [Hyaloraphidium curvatum]
MEDIRRWLKSVLVGYPHADRVFRDADAALVKYSGLSPKHESFTHDTGQTVVLLCLHGTVPVQFRGNTYNIPVAVWIPHNYPFQPAMCYVVPTPQMLIRPSKHVDLSGKIYHPYLAHWHDRVEESTIVDFLVVLQQIFGQEPPVYTKPSNPPPAMAGAAKAAPSASSTLPSRPPPYNPVGPSASASALPDRSSTPERAAHAHSFSQTSRQSADLPPPPPPLRPPAEPADSWSGSPTTAAPPYSRTPNPTDLLARPLTDGGLLSDISSGVAPPSGLRDPLRPRPSNPRDALREKVQASFASYSQHMTENMERDLMINKRLNDSEKRVVDSLRRLQEEAARIDRNTEGLLKAGEEMREAVEALRSHPEVDPDQALAAPYPLYNQILELNAEEQAIEDLIYHLSRALNSERIDLATFMKHVRTLAREQFMKRALIKKCRETARLRPA